MTVNPHYSAKAAVESKTDMGQESPDKLKPARAQTKAAKPAYGKRPRMPGSLPTNARSVTEKLQPNAARTGRNRASARTAPTELLKATPAAPTAPKSTA